MIDIGKIERIILIMRLDSRLKLKLLKNNLLLLFKLLFHKIIELYSFPCMDFGNCKRGKNKGKGKEKK